MAKAARRKAPAPLVTCRIAELMMFEFSDEVIEDRETFRRFAHHVVDLLFDNGRDGSLSGDVADNLAYIGREQIIKHATDLVHEVWAEGEECRRG